MANRTETVFPLRVLIVDDHALVALSLTEALRGAGYHIVGSVASGEQAIEAAAEYLPDVVIMDVDLRGDMDGIAAAIEIRKRLGIRSIFFTGYSDESSRNRAADADPIAVLDKTSQVAAITNVLRTVVPHETH